MLTASTMIYPDERLAVFVPRGFRLQEAARYVGLRETKFLEGVKDGRFPVPRMLDSAVIWDRVELDAAFDNLPRQARRGQRPNGEDSAPGGAQ